MIRASLPYLSVTAECDVHVSPVPLSENFPARGKTCLPAETARFGWAKQGGSLAGVCVPVIADGRELHHSVIGVGSFSI